MSCSAECHSCICPASHHSRAHAVTFRELMRRVTYQHYAVPYRLAHAFHTTLPLVSQRIAGTFDSQAGRSRSVTKLTIPADPLDTMPLPCRITYAIVPADDVSASIKGHEVRSVLQRAASLATPVESRRSGFAGKQWHLMCMPFSVPHAALIQE